MQSTSRESRHDLGFQKGMRASTAYTTLLRAIPRLGGISLFKYKPPTRLEGRLSMSDPAMEILLAARGMKVRLGIPFWDCVANLCIERGTLPDGIVSGAIFHQEMEKGRIRLSAEDVRSGAVELAVEKDGMSWQLALSSKVVLDSNATVHIPMIDFQCPARQANGSIVERIARELLTGGAIVLCSGNSYHAVGTDPVSPNELNVILGRSLLYGGFVDQRYIAHQIIQGECCLRVSSSLDGTPEPTVIGWF